MLVFQLCRPELLPRRLVRSLQGRELTLISAGELLGLLAVLERQGLADAVDGLQVALQARRFDLFRRLGLALLAISNPANVSVVDALSKMSHDPDGEVATAAIVSLGLVACGTNNSRCATALRSLVLYDNALGPKGGALLAAALRRESSLTLLDLRLNQLCGVDSFGNGEFTCEAVRSLANALDANETLSWLRLEHNAVPRHAAGWMRDAGRRRPGLRVSL